MKRKFVPTEESFRQWKKDPKYTAAYAALEEEFASASASIKATPTRLRTNCEPDHNPAR